MIKVRTKVATDLKVLALSKLKIVGKYSKKNLGTTWARLLKLNRKRKWNDRRLLRKIKKEFPGRDHSFSPATWRSYYNNGRIRPNGKPTYKPPKRISLAYDDLGNPKKRQKGRPR